MTWQCCTCHTHCAGFLMVMPMKICTGELQFVHFFRALDNMTTVFFILWPNQLGKPQVILKQFTQLHWHWLTYCLWRGLDHWWKANSGLDIRMTGMECASAASCLGHLALLLAFSSLQWRLQYLTSEGCFEHQSHRNNGWENILKLKMTTSVITSTKIYQHFYLIWRMVKYHQFETWKFPEIWITWRRTIFWANV